MALIKSTIPRGKRGRPKNTHKSVRWTLVLHEAVAAPWELLFTDPVIGRARQNSRNLVISRLLELTFDAWRNGRSTIDITEVNQLISSKIQTPLEPEDYENPDDTP